jgi:hypothetical protein
MPFGTLKGGPGGGACRNVSSVVHEMHLKRVRNESASSRTRSESLRTWGVSDSSSSDKRSQSLVSRKRSGKDDSLNFPALEDEVLYFFTFFFFLLSSSYL